MVSVHSPRLATSVRTGLEPMPCSICEQPGMDRHSLPVHLAHFLQPITPSQQTENQANEVYLSSASRHFHSLRNDGCGIKLSSTPYDCSCQCSGSCPARCAPAERNLPQRSFSACVP